MTRRSGPAPIILNSQSGFTLLELLLVIGVTAVMFLGIMQITRSWMQAEIAGKAGQHMQRVTTAVREYVEANGVGPLAETADAINGGAAGWADLRAKLEQENLLNAGVLQSPLGVPLQISFSKNGSVSHTVIFATAPLPYDRVMDAAKQTGNSGGFLSVLPDANNAYGGYGQWRVAATQLYPASAGVFPCIPTARGQSCFLSLISHTDEELCGLYLYRNPTSASCGGNAMATDLRMNNNNISNANEVQTANMTVNQDANLGQMAVAGTTTLNGQTAMSGGLDITGGDMTVNGDATFTNNVTASNTLRALKLDVATIDAERIETTNLDTDQMNVAGKLAVDENMSVNGDVTIKGTGIYASEINAGQVNAGDGQIRVGTVDVQNNMNINGNVAISGGTVSTDQLVIKKCTRIDIGSGASKNYGDC